MYQLLEAEGRSSPTDLRQQALRTADGFTGSPVVSFKRSAFNNGATKLGETVCRLACSFKEGMPRPSAVSRYFS